jgi:hypothetical protein
MMKEKMPMEEMDTKPDFLDIDKDGDKKESMKKAVMDKKCMKESVDLGNLFEGQELSEEFKTTAIEIFESAVKMRVEQELEDKIASLQEEFNEYSLKESTELKESLVEKIDGYLGYMVEQWMEKNELAITRGIKTEILESFVSGLKGVFESHYIDVPDEKYDLVEAAQTESAELEKRLDEQVAKNVELVQSLKGIARQIAIDEACADLVATDAEKFKQLAEELTYNESTFEAKLNTIKESYFSTKKSIKQKELTEEFMTDMPVDELNEDVKKIDPDMARYLTAFTRTAN